MPVFTLPAFAPGPIATEPLGASASTLASSASASAFVLKYLLPTVTVVLLPSLTVFTVIPEFSAALNSAALDKSNLLVSTPTVTVVVSIPLSSRTVSTFTFAMPSPLKLTTSFGVTLSLGEISLPVASFVATSLPSFLTKKPDLFTV